MTLGSKIWAIVDAYGRILGDGDGHAIYEYPPIQPEIVLGRSFCNCPDARVVECVISIAAQSSPPPPLPDTLPAGV